MATHKASGERAVGLLKYSNVMSNVVQHDSSPIFQSTRDHDNRLYNAPTKESSRNWSRNTKGLLREDCYEGIDHLPTR